MSQKSDAALNRYIAHRLDAVLAPDGQRPKAGQRSVRDVAAEVGVSGATINDVRRGKRGVGIEALLKFAAWLGLSLDELRAAATQWAAQNPEDGPAPTTKLELDDRYPNRGKAADLARGYLSEEAISLVTSKAYDLDHDPPAGWWYERIQAAESELKMLRRDPGKAERDTERRRAALEEIKRSQGDGE